MNILQNIDLISVGVTIAAIGIMGFVVFFNNKKSITNRSFLLFAVLTILYGGVNYLHYQTKDPVFILLFLRLTIFFALWHAFSVFQLFFVWPQEKFTFPHWYTRYLLPLIIVTSIITLTSLVFSAVVIPNDQQGVADPIRGPFMPLFGVVSTGLVVTAVFLLARKMYFSRGESRRQLKIVFLGTAITFSLLIIFNVILPLIFHVVQFVPFAPLFIFPFLGFTAYAIIWHKLMNVKVVSTEILVFFLSVLVLTEVIFGGSPKVILYRSVLFIFILILGVLLIKSVRKEVNQRTELAELAVSLEKANVRLKELDQQKTEFLSIASHQLRTPLSVIKGYLGLLEDGVYGKTSKKVQGVFEDMDVSNERLIALVDEFLDITRIEQGRAKYEFAPANMKDVVQDVIKELTQRAQKKTIDLTSHVDRHLPEIIMDKEKIRHVIYNFVDNAIKYSDQGVVKVLAGLEKDGVGVRVQDNGFGFTKEDEENFFQKFYRGKNVEGTNVNGTGLGIYVCKKFIEMHGGRVWARSSGLGQGSEFGFWIPLKAAKPVE